jgi:TPR repeat protein
MTKFLQQDPRAMVSQLAGVLMVTALLGGGACLADAQSDYEAGLRAYQIHDLIKAMTLLESAGAEGHPAAQVLLGNIHDTAEDNEKAVHWYRMAADQGDAEGMRYLGEKYLLGEGVEQQAATGLELIDKAARAGSVLAMRLLASQFESEPDVDHEQAVHWYRVAAENGDVVSNRRLAKAYENGELGLQPNAEEAARYQPDQSANDDGS